LKNKQQGQMTNLNQREEQRVGRRIRVNEVRVIDHLDEQRGIMSTCDAMELADSVGLQLVEVNPKANPPVCKVMDYGKYKYETAKRERETKKNQKTLELKQVKFRPKTHEHDFATKLRSIERFITGGNKVKMTVQLKGRETVHPDVGHDMLMELCKATAAFATPSLPIVVEGNNLSLMLNPRSIAQQQQNS
jgi:translation initiation factor IF-3